LGTAVILLSLIYFLLPKFVVRADIFILGLIVLYIFILTWRLLYNEILRRGLFNKQMIVIGADGLAQQIINDVNSKKDCGYNIACIVLEKYHKGTLKDARSPIIRKNNYKDLCVLAKKMNIKTIVVAIREKRNNFPTTELLKCRMDGIEIIDGVSFYEMLKGKIDVTEINPGWLIFSDGFKKSRITVLSKRIVDILISFILVLLLSPLLLIVALLIKVDTKGPVFFFQERVGKDKRSYSVVKFRSMVVDAEKECGPVWADCDDGRVTRVGRIIRALRIDEIPQIWNVLKGEMSFVGPRPERAFFVAELEKQIPYYNERFSVKPGITGWAQINYDYSASLEETVEKLNYDLFYIKNMSIFMDLMIIFKTVKTVIFRQGAR
jgi:sugar transferase (PEP-CTERM system associated)